MLSSLRYAALAAMVTSVCGYTLGQMPSQTVGVGMPLMDIMPTQAPSMELVKRSLEKKALTNTCLEWTILGGGLPICGASETCLFTSATDGYLYEGCGLTSVPYDWVTLCSAYPQTKSGTVPVSEIWCPSTAPACGYYAFAYDSSNTFYNFGCSTTSYFSTAVLVSTSSASSSAIALPGGGTSQVIPTTVTVIEPAPTFGGTGTATSTSSTSSGSSSSSTGNPITKKVPIAAIAGGVIGGVALIAFAVFMTWFCMRRHQKNKSKTPEIQEQTHNANASAFNNYQNPHIAELGGTGKPTTVFPSPAAHTGANGVYGEKPAMQATMQEFHRPAPTSNGELLGDRISTHSPPPQSPPPQYASPSTPGSPPINYPPSNITELENLGRQSIPPLVSPIGTGTYSSPNLAHSSPSSATYSTPTAASELTLQQQRQSLNSQTNELPNSQQQQRQSYNSYQANQSQAGSQEMPNSQHQNYYTPYPPNQPQPGTQEMPGASYISHPPNQPQPGTQELPNSQPQRESYNTLASELPNSPQRQSYTPYPPNQTQPGTQEMPGASYVAYPPNQVRVGAQEMPNSPQQQQRLSGTGGIALPRRAARQSGMDMSGNPLGEDWEGQELP